LNESIPGKQEPLELTFELLEALQQEFSVDSRRIYLTGFSMGAFGAWIGAARRPETFAAVVAIAGGGDASHIGATKAAVWAFHGAKDRVVPPSRSRAMVEAVRQAGGVARYTEFPELGHDIRDRALSEPGLADWLFEQRLD
jgi:predicted peptidase